MGLRLTVLGLCNRPVGAGRPTDNGIESLELGEVSLEHITALLDHREVVRAHLYRILVDLIRDVPVHKHISTLESQHPAGHSIE